MIDKLRMVSGSTMRLRAFIQRLRRNEKGAVAPLFLVSAGLVFGVALGAIDLARYTAVTARLQSSLDNAALAAGRLASLTGQSGDLLAEARAYLEANFPDAYLGSQVDPNSLSLDPSNNGGSLTLRVQGRLPLLSTGFLNVSAFGLDTRSVVSLGGIIDLEVIFALDKGEPLSGNSNAAAAALNDSAATLANLILRDGTQAIPGVYLGLVPFSDTVNVGDAGIPWVSRWQEEQLWAGNTRLEHSNKNYTSAVWRGCIAEPRPWTSPSLSVSALTPMAIFQPVFVRVTTRFNEKGNEPTWKSLPLKGLDAGEEVAGDASSYEYPLPLKKNGNVSDTFDRRLWAEYGGRSKGKTDGDAVFNVYGAFEPENCLVGNRSHFLQNDYPVIETALSTIASEALRGDTLLPAGLLWSWRMLHPDWRGGTGWSVNALPSEGGPKKQVIVLFAGGNNVDWAKVNADPAGNPHNIEQWADTNNHFAFKLNYFVKECPPNGKNCTALGDPREHVQAPFLPEKKKQQASDWQRPSTSLLMADPFSDNMIKPDISGWPSIGAYTAAVCDAIKAQNINIYVVNVNGSGNKALANCSSVSKVYSIDELDELRNLIQQARTTSAELRLTE